jgi:lipopolysaccharide transport system ATP-binding protein
VGEPETAIRVEELSKRYVISHMDDKGRYSTLRDTIARSARSFARRILKGRSSRVDNSIEEFWALKNISFEVKRGEVVGVIGRNGAGKSTLLKILSRITEPTTGRIAIDGRVASLLEVGTGFHPELTGRENIFLNGAILGMSRAEIKRKFDDIVAFAEIEKFLDTPVKRYSSGMYVRLAFAVAAHLEADILIVDEVLAVGDQDFQKKCLGKMGDLASSGRTVLFVSHNLSVVNHLCRKALYLKSGQIEHFGTTEEVVSMYVGGFGRGNYVRAPRSDRPSVTSIDISPEMLAAGELRVAVRFESPIEFEPVVGIVVSTDSGSPLFGTNRLIHSNGCEPVRFCSGEAVLSIPDVPLHSGAYHLSVWLGETSGMNYEHLPDVVAFDFVSSDPLPSQYQTRVIGATRVDAQWTFNPGNSIAAGPVLLGVH